MISYFRRLAWGAASTAANWIVGRITGPKAEPPEGITRIRHEPAKRPVASPATPEAAVPQDVSGAQTLGETRGSGRDERSFEQRRRGGPLTGEGPSKIRGPRHTGGGRRRGRDEVEDEDEALAIFPDLPILDYDELSPGAIEARIRTLDAGEVRLVLDYETRNKHRKSILDALSKRLAA